MAGRRSSRRRLRLALLGAGAAVVVLVVVAVLAFVPRASSPTTTAADLKVSVTGGQVQGVILAGLRLWGDLPYAAPPVGHDRWRAPQSVVPWDGVRDASQAGPPCLQPAQYTFGQTAPLSPTPGSSEDCLHLNIVAPDGDDTGLPVMVWFHGGGFLTGAASGTPYDSGAYAARGVIQVGVDYRLGQLGFFAHRGLKAGVANYGLLDQVAALRWVRDNIAAFGGDPSQVTIAGESAGGMSVNALMVMPQARGLFRAAISQSGLGDEQPKTYAQARQDGDQEFPGLTPAQLRALPASKLLDSSFNIFYGDAPILDDVLPQRVADAFAEHKEAPVPYLVGTTDGEFPDDFFRIAGLDPDALRATIAQRDPGLEQRYDQVGGADAFRSFVLDDVVFSAPALRLAAEHASIAPTYRYRFSAGAPGTTYHGADVDYMYDDVPAPGDVLAGEMTDYWAAFVRSGGTPASPGLPTWPQATPDGSALMLLGPTSPVPAATDPWANRLALTPSA